jgi:spermidine/putrescine transport system substrate-binding protein
MRKKLKIVAALIVAIMCFGFLAACNRPSGNDIVLRIFNWMDYIDEDLVEQFEREASNNAELGTLGRNVRVDYQVFDTNETMFTRVVNGNERYDLIAPSDYMIERMISTEIRVNGQLQPLLMELDAEKIPNYMNNVSPFIKNNFDIFNPAENDGKMWAAGYMWGTLGILYNVNKVQETIGASNDVGEFMSNWGALMDPRFRGEVYMKDSVRDTTAALALYLKESGGLENLGKTITLTQVINFYHHDEIGNFFEEMLDRLEATIRKQRVDVNTMFEVDIAKDSLAEGRSTMALMWSGDAAYSMYMGMNPEEPSQTGKNAGSARDPIVLDYAIPSVGTNVWADGWVIPSTSEQSVLAHEFINFLSDPENAIKNMEYIMYTSVIGGQDVFDTYIMGDDGIYGWFLNEECTKTIDLSYFFPGVEGANAVRVHEAFYPCGSRLGTMIVMTDFGEENNAALTSMWIRARSDSYPWVLIIIVIGVAVAGLVTMLILRKRVKGDNEK